MAHKVLRRTRHSLTGPLRKLGTRPLANTGLLRGDTGLLPEQQPSHHLLAQVDKLLNETQVLSARLDAINDVAVAVNSSLNLDAIFKVIVEKARDALGFDYCAVGMVEDDGTQYVLNPLVWPDGSFTSPRRQAFDMSVGLPGAVISLGKPVMVQDLSEHPLRVRPARFPVRVSQELEGWLALAGMRSLMVVPLIANGRTLGSLSFAKNEPSYYSQDDLQLAYLFSMQLAIALNNSRLFDAESRRSNQLQMLNDIGSIATSILDPQVLLAKIPPLVQTYFGYDVVKIGLLEGSEVFYSQAAQSIAGRPEAVEMRMLVSVDGMPVGFVGLATYTAQLVMVPNVYEDERWADVADTLAGPHIRSVLAIPMVAKDKVLGVLHFESRRVGAFSKADIAMLQSLANQIAVALDNASLYHQLNELFHGYIAPQVASTLLNNPSNAELGGQRREVTVLFADLEGFTGLSEKIPAEELIKTLNACLSAATDAVLEYGGTLDKYMGDAVMALFNAPDDDPYHAWRAMCAATSMQRRLKELTEEWEHKMCFSIGINTGEAIVGNIGSMSLRNYTAIGDTVNLAKRLQEVAASGQVLASRSSYEAAIRRAPTGRDEIGQEQIAMQALGTIPVKGRVQPVLIYEIDAYSAPASPNMLLSTLPASHRPNLGAGELNSGPLYRPVDGRLDEQYLSNTPEEQVWAEISEPLESPESYPQPVDTGKITPLFTREAPATGTRSDTATGRAEEKGDDPGRSATHGNAITPLRSSPNKLSIPYPFAD